MNTTAIQSAINACPAGGLVWLHDGTFLSGTVILHANMTFYIDTNATLLGSGSTNDYPILSPAAKDDSQQATMVLISAQACTNVTITGGGTINGNGGYSNYPTNYTGIRPTPICTELCTNVTIQNLTISNSAGWNVVNVESDYLTINNVNINDRSLCPYRDGFDICDCWHVIIENCTNINAGDDAIVLKTGSPRGVNDFVATNCTVTGAAANGFKLGTTSTSTFTNILFEDCTVLNAANAAMAVESIDGGAIRGLTFQGINFSGCQCGIFVILGSRDSGVLPGSIDGVVFRDITGSNMTGTVGSSLSGTEMNGVTYGLNNILFDNVNVAFPGGLKYIPANPPEYAGQYPVNTMWSFLPAYGYYIRHATNVTFTNCNSIATVADARPWLATDDVSALALIAAPLNVPPSVAGFGSAGAGWTLNGGATVTSNVLELTDGSGNEARSAYYNVPQLVDSFQAQFVYQANGQADGVAFVMQNAAAGLNAVGAAGGGLGYGGIAESAAVKFNIYHAASGGMGTRLSAGGSSGTYGSTLPVNLGSGDPIGVSLDYNGTTLTENLTDSVTGASFSTNYTVNIPAAVGGGNTALIGFTGGDGGATSVQTISDFTYSPLPAIAGSGWTFNGGATVTGNALNLTDGGTYEDRSAFLNVPQPVNCFQAQFIYQANGQANGAVFVMQNAPAGLNALGTVGGGLGYGGILQSAGVELNIYSAATGGIGTQLATGGSVGSFIPTVPINLASGDPIEVVLSYNGSSLGENLVDLMSGASYSTNYTVNIPAAVGGSNLALVGFTGADGGSTSAQTILDFSFTPVNLQTATPIIYPSGGGFTNSVAVSLTLPSNAPSSQIYYTLNGAAPTTNSTVYSKPFTLTQTTTVEAMTVVPGFVNGPVTMTIFTNTVTGFGGSGSGWTFNGGATATNNVLELTDGGSFEARSAFFNLPQIVSNFQAQFIYQAAAVGKTPLGDGAVFVVQNAPAGVRALGDDGGGLGYVSINVSVAIDFYLGSGMGTRLATGGSPGSYTSTLPVNLDSGDPIWVGLNYNGSSLTETLVDMTTEASYTTNYAVNIPLAVGGANTAFVGFTGGGGASVAVQTISDFTFTFGSSAAIPENSSTNAPDKQVITLPPTMSVAAAGNQLSIFWPTSASAYHLEFTTNLSAPASWKAAPQTPVISNGQFTITVPKGTTSTFFHLASP